MGPKSLLHARSPRTFTWIGGVVSQQDRYGDMSRIGSVLHAGSLLKTFSCRAVGDVVHDEDEDGLSPSLSRDGAGETVDVSRVSCCSAASHDLHCARPPTNRPLSLPSSLPPSIAPRAPLSPHAPFFLPATPRQSVCLRHHHLLPSTAVNSANSAAAACHAVATLPTPPLSPPPADSASCANGQPLTMNSLNIVSRFTATPPPSPPRSRTASSGHIHTLASNGDGSSTSALDFASMSEKLHLTRKDHTAQAAENDARDEHDYVNEKTPLLSSGHAGVEREEAGRGWNLPRRAAAAVLYGVKVVFSTITAPGRYVIACFYDDQGHFSTIMPFRRFKHIFVKRKRSTAHAVGLGSVQEEDEKPRAQRKASSRRSPSVDSTTSTATAGSSDGELDSPAKHTRSRSKTDDGEDAAPRKSIRIKVHNDEALRKRKASKAKKNTNHDDVAVVASALKSPSSPTSSKLTRYPRTPAPPRPLIPKRQPSYSLQYTADAPRKTLVIDLDETLIHSMAKGGRMSTGHMVEVRLGGTVSSSGVQIGPGVPILYYVHERPGCHDFLRKVRKWYNLIAFTASVQEYADPVIDWLERETKYFSGRYYRQHCTYRNGAYIKDLAQVEPDLSKVMILDNSPMSYIFHEDNAIPIEGWISDPTDKELLHLVPLLEGLQYVTDVRALLALRQGQAQQA